MTYLRKPEQNSKKGFEKNVRRWGVEGISGLGNFLRVYLKAI